MTKRGVCIQRVLSRRARYSLTPVDLLDIVPTVDVRLSRGTPLKLAAYITDISMWSTPERRGSNQLSHTSIELLCSLDTDHNSRRDREIVMEVIQRSYPNGKAFIPSNQLLQSKSA